MYLKKLRWDIVKTLEFFNNILLYSVTQIIYNEAPNIRANCEGGLD